MKTYSYEKIDAIQFHFIVAKARTGSTLLSTMLGRHPKVLSIIEKPFPYFLFPKYGKIKKWTDKIIDAYCADFFLFCRYNLLVQFSSLEELKGTLITHQENLNYHRATTLTALCFTPQKDKSEVEIILFKELIIVNFLLDTVQLFPHAKFIFLHRSPLDNVARVRNMKKVKRNSKNAHVYAISQQWQFYYKLLLSKKNKMALGRAMDVKYEDLIEHTEPSIQRLCNFLDLEFIPEMAQNNQAKKSDSSLKKFDPKYKMEFEEYQKLHEGIFMEPDKKKINLWKNELNERETMIIWKICRKPAIILGYNFDNQIKPIRLSLRYYYYKMKIYFQGRIIVGFWYASPYFLKRTIKQVKYKMGK
jgi:hypothetical protein